MSIDDTRDFAAQALTRRLKVIGLVPGRRVSSPQLRRSRRKGWRARRWCLRWVCVFRDGGAFSIQGGRASQRLTRPLRRRQQGSRHPSGRHRPARARAPRLYVSALAALLASRGARVWEVAGGTLPARPARRGHRDPGVAAAAELRTLAAAACRDRAGGACRARRRAGRRAAGSTRPAAEELHPGRAVHCYKERHRGGRAPHRPSLTPGSTRCWS